MKAIKDENKKREEDEEKKKKMEKSLKKMIKRINYTQEKLKIKQ
jgi:hypothetical protein